MTIDFSVTNITDIEFRFLFYEFPYIVKNASITDAAKELHTSQTALSKRLATVEKKYGITLVERKQGAAQLIKITPAGEIVLEASSAIGYTCDKIVESFDRLKRQDERETTFTTSVEASFQELLFQTNSFLKENRPNLRLKHQRRTSKTSFDLIRDKSIDIAFEPYSIMADTHGLVSTPLFCEPAVIVIDESSPLANKVHVSIQAIKDLCFMSTTDNSDYSIRKHLHSVAREYAFPAKLNMKPVSSVTVFLFDRIPKNTAIFLPLPYARTMTSASSHISVVEIEEPNCQFDMRAFYRDDSHTPQIDLILSALQTCLNRELPNLSN